MVLETKIEELEHLIKKLEIKLSKEKVEAKYEEECTTSHIIRNKSS